MENFDNTRKHHVLKTVNPFGVFIIATGGIESWVDGDCIAFRWRWYHPMAWILAPGFFSLAFILGETSDKNDRAKIGFGLSDYWSKNKNEREFIRIRDLILLTKPLYRR